MVTKKSSNQIFFCGITKNCINNIQSNLNFIENFLLETKFKTNIIFVDSDSIDGTKNTLSLFSNKHKNVVYTDLDGLENQYSNRIERILISRNKCLEIMDSINVAENIVYIPLDLDIDLFKYLNVEKFENLIDYCIQKDIPNGLFPFSEPYYYDIFALRATNWVDYNAQYWVKRMKKSLKIGSFLYNYILIFRHQISLSSYKNKKSKINSAFGGAGIYKIENNYKKYELSKEYPEDVSEHIQFNSQFAELEIIKDWIIQAPLEHLEFRLLAPKDKIKYFIKTLKFDIKNLSG
jgi:hypothetical protein